MFAAAAIIAQTVWRGVLAALLWTAQKTFFAFLLFLVLPLILRKAIIYGIETADSYGIELTGFISDFMTNLVSTVAPGSQANFSLTSVGAYIGYHTGLLEYFSIIIGALASCWYVAIMKTLVNSSLGASWNR